MSVTDTTYNSVAKILHWVIAILVLGLLVLGWTMTQDSLPHGPLKRFLYQMHQSFGITVLGLSVLRLMWMLINPPPPLPEEGLARSEINTIKVTHFCFYLLILGIPLTGWAWNSTAIHNLMVFDVHLPNIPYFPDVQDKMGLIHTILGVHSALSYTFVLLLFLHVGAALKHTSILRRIVPGFVGRYLDKKFPPVVAKVGTQDYKKNKNRK